MSPAIRHFLTTLAAIAVMFLAMSVESAQRDMTRCDYVYKADVQRKGVFQSPNYPHSYPLGLTCRFRFIGAAIDRVRLRFTHLSLRYHGEDSEDPFSCDDVDLVVISYNGTPRPFAKYCGSKVPPITMSTDNMAEVLFFSRASSSSFPSYSFVESVGFHAEFAFVSDFGVQGGELWNPGVCHFVVRSERSKSGSITSPNYPGLYPRNIDCRYVFVGTDDQRVTINFTHFDVEGMPPGCLESTQSDYVEFEDVETWLLGGDWQQQRRLCREPNGHRPFHSVLTNSASLTMVFHSNEVYDGTGFTANYQFNERQGEDVRSDKQARTTFGISGSRTCYASSLAVVMVTVLVTASHLLVRSCCISSS